MFERFTDRNRRVVVLAQEHARLLHHNYIGTEHLLIGILAEQENLGALVLRNLNFSLDSVTERVRHIVGAGDSAPSGARPFTPRSKKAMELSLREALGLGHNYIAPEHTLLGIIREGEGVAVQIMEHQHPLSKIRNDVLIAMRIGPGDEQPIEPVPSMTPTFAIGTCTSVLTMLETDQERRAVLAYLSAWFA